MQVKESGLCVVGYDVMQHSWRYLSTVHCTQKYKFSLRGISAGIRISIFYWNDLSLNESRTWVQMLPRNIRVWWKVWKKRRKSNEKWDVRRVQSHLDEINGFVFVLHWKQYWEMFVGVLHRPTGSAGGRAKRLSPTLQSHRGSPRKYPLDTSLGCLSCHKRMSASL